MAFIRETIERYDNQTLEDLELLPEGTLAQLIDGEIVMSPAPSLLHQHIAELLAFEFGTYARRSRSGRVFFAPLDVHLSERYVVQPDLVFISRDRAPEVLSDAFRGVPDLVVEILSPSTGYYDLTKKRDAYERFGVKEYWIVDPERKRVEILVLEDGAYRTNHVATGEGRVCSVLLEGFEVDIAPMFELPGRLGS